MLVRLDSSALRQAKWGPYAIRFLFGGIVTAAAGLVAQRYGPVMGGLLLAFPAIFPASATLIEKHEKQQKEKRGMSGTMRGRQAASVDAAGSAMGSLGLILFAVIVWRLLPGHRTWVVLGGAAVGWAVVSVGAWLIRKRVRIGRRHVRVAADHA
jgi:Protein of unknown function (DUF3147)